MPQVADINHLVPPSRCQSSSAISLVDEDGEDAMQAQEQKLAGLADRLLRLRATGASPRQRESLIVRTMTEINEIRRTTPHISQKVCGPMRWTMPHC